MISYSLSLSSSKVSTSMACKLELCFVYSLNNTSTTHVHKVNAWSRGCLAQVQFWHSSRIPYLLLFQENSYVQHCDICTITANTLWNQHSCLEFDVLRGLFSIVVFKCTAINCLQTTTHLSFSSIGLCVWNSFFTKLFFCTGTFEPVIHTYNLPI